MPCAASDTVLWSKRGAATGLSAAKQLLWLQKGQSPVLSPLQLCVLPLQSASQSHLKMFEIAGLISANIKVYKIMEKIM